MSLGNVFRLGVKELRSLRADLALSFLIVYAFTAAIYTVATGVKFEVQDAAVAFVDDDHSELSRSIRHALLPPYFKPAEEIAADQVDRAMDTGRYVFVIEIPPKFEADLLAGRHPSVLVNVDATAMSQAGNGAGYIQSIIAQEALAYAGRAEGVTEAPVNLVVRARFNPNLDSGWFTPVMEVINNITMLSLILAGAALIREREHGTIEHLLVMPVTPTEIMLAKIWANGLVIVVAAALSLWLVVQRVLGVPIVGSVPLFLVGAVLYQFSVTSLGLLAATFTGSMPQFSLLVLPIIILMELLSGATTPLESMPAWLQAVMQISPSTHFVAFAQATLYRGADFAIVWPYLAALAGIGAVYFLISLLRFRTAITSYQ
ncbi:MAG: ABC transporter permease [Candidatus Eiseniibacteriota bacterium]